MSATPSSRRARVVAWPWLRVVAIVIAIGLAAVGAWLVRCAAESDPAPDETAAAAPVAVPAAPAVTRSNAEPAASSASLRIEPSPALSAQVDRLSRSADPADAYAAYGLVLQCLGARARLQAGAGGDAASLALACGDITAAQVEARLTWLDRAARAGVRNAARDFGAEGPHGLLVPREAQGDWEADDAWQTRIAGYYAAGAASCDQVSVMSVVARYRLGLYDADPATALKTWSAAQECIALEKAPAQPPDPRDSEVGPTLGAQLGPAEAAAAVAAGQVGARAAPAFGAP